MRTFVLRAIDSIVRGTTSKEIILMARDAGAKKVFMASCAPPIRYPNVYGIDMPSAQELVAHNRTEKEIAEYIGADLVIFQKLDDLIESCRSFNRDIETFDCSVFTGKYVTGGVDETYLAHIQSLREDSAKQKQANSFRLNVSAEQSANGWRSNTPQPKDGGKGDTNGNEHDNEFLGCSGPMNGADAIGLYNEASPSKRKGSQSRNDGNHDSLVGLPNSFYSGIATMDVNDIGVSEGANAVAGGAGAASNPTAQR